LVTETPLASKAFKLVSFAILIAIVVITLSAAYSGYEEYNALTTVVSGTSQGQLSASLNGSALQISGLNVPNKMTYPLSLEFLGNVSIANAQIGSFDSGAYVIQPGFSKDINISVGLNFSRILTNSGAFQAALFNSSILSINSTIAARIIPLLGINITKAANSTLGPVMSNLAVSVETSRASLTPDGQSVLVPVQITWINQSPITTNLWLNATLTQIPEHSPGRYGFASGPLSLAVGGNNETYVMRLPTRELLGGNLQHGTYSVQLNFSESQFSKPLAQITKSGNV
jgi:hypothetical protein